MLHKTIYFILSTSLDILIHDLKLSYATTMIILINLHVYGQVMVRYKEHMKRGR